jgi:hypothetical protein
MFVRLKRARFTVDGRRRGCAIWLEACVEAWWSFGGIGLRTNEYVERAVYVTSVCGVVRNRSHVTGFSRSEVKGDRKQYCRRRVVLVVMLGAQVGMRMLCVASRVGAPQPRQDIIGSNECSNIFVQEIGDICMKLALTLKSRTSFTDLVSQRYLLHQVSTEVITHNGKRSM